MRRQIISLTEEVLKAQQSNAAVGPSSAGGEALARQAAVASTSAAAPDIITTAPTIQLSSILPSTVSVYSLYDVIPLYPDAAYDKEVC